MKSLLVDCSSLPASIIIVGIGNRSFGQMEEFNKGLLTDDSGNVAKRNFVRFVEFKDFEKNGNIAEEALK